MKPILQSVLLALALASTSLPAPAVTNYWRGGPGNALWSNPNNWDPPGVPQDGAILWFDYPGGVISNDLPNLRVSFLNFGGHGNEWQLRGNALRVDLIRNFHSSLKIQCDLQLADPGALVVWGDVDITGDIDLNGHSLELEVVEGETLELTGPIFGDGQIRIRGGGARGVVKMNGTAANTFNGSVTLETGTRLVLDKQSGAALPGALDIGVFGTVTLERPHQIADTSTVVVRHGARFWLQGHTETISGLYLSGGNPGAVPRAAEVDTGGGTLSVADNITAVNTESDTIPVIKGVLGLPPGTHNIHTSGTEQWALNIQAQIIGDGGFTKMGGQGLVLSGSNRFNGDAILQEGRVEIRHPNALGAPAGATLLAGGALDVTDLAIGNETLIVNRSSPGTASFAASLISWGVCSWAGPVILNTNLAVNGGSMTFSGAVSGPAGLYILNTGTQLEGSAPNTYEGLTHVDGSLLELNKPSGVRAISARLEVHSGGGRLGEVRWQQDYQSIGVDVTLFTDALIHLNGHRDDFGPITFNGGAIATGTGELGLSGLVTVNPSGTEAAIHGRLGLPPGLHEFRVGDGAPLADLSVNAVVAGSGSLRKTGPGQMWLNNSNTYGGLTVVAEGSLVAFDADALGASSVGTAVSEGASLILNAPNSTVREPIGIAGTGDGSHGALNVFGSVRLRNSFPSMFPCLELTTNTTIRVEPGSVLTMDGIVSGVGPLTKLGPGMLVLANINPNTYSGDTCVTEGVLNLSKPNFAISVPGNLVVGPAPQNATAIARWSTDGGMHPGAMATINAGSLLDLNGNGLSLSRLNLNDGGDAQTGAGRLDFPVFGMVAVGSLSQAGSHAGSTLSGNIGLPPNGTLTFAVNGYAHTAPFDFNPELDVAASMAAPAESPGFERAGLAKTGGGTARLSGNNSFHGRVDIAEGTLMAASSAALGSSSDGTFVLNGAKLALAGGLTFDNEVLVLNSTGTPALESLPGETFWNGPVILGRHSSVGAGAASLLRLAGVVSGAANFTKVGAGILRFEGGDPNTYLGETFVDEGTLLLSKPLAVTAVPGLLSIGTPAGLPAMVANLNSYQIVGNILVNRGGVLNVNDQVENVDHLWLTEGGDVHATTGVLSLKTGGSIQVLPGAVNDPSSISGVLEMLAGSHTIRVAASTGPSGGPDLDISATVTSSGGSITLQKTGAGTLRLGANNTYAGGAIVNAGCLQVDGSQPSSHVFVLGGARLSGNGRAGPVFFADPSAVVAPGASPGHLLVGDFNLDGASGGTLQIEMNGTAAGSGYDRLSVRGFVDLNTLTLQAAVNFAAAIGDQFRIIENDSTDPIVGAFNGLPQGATVTFGDHIFQIDYSGGDGNDVVLTKTGHVYRPALTIQSVAPASVRLLWPTNDPAFTLQFTTNLSGTNFGGWTAVPETPSVSGTNRVVTSGAAGRQRYYRLSKP